MIGRELRSTLTKDSFALRSPMARLMFWRPPSMERARTQQSPRTGATRRPREENCLARLQQEADQNDDINGGDINMSACRQQGRRARVMKENISRPLGRRGLRFGKRLRSPVTAAVL